MKVRSTVMVIILGVLNGLVLAGQYANESLSVCNSSSIRLGDKRVQLKLSSKGQVVAIEDLVTNTSLLVSSGHQAAWKLTYGGKGVAIKGGAGEQLDSLSYPAPKIKKINESVVFEWAKSDCPTVVGTVRFNAKEGQFHFSVKLSGQKKVVDQIAFPAQLNFSKDSGNGMLVSADIGWATTLKPLNSMKPLSVMYPGKMQMQMTGFKIADSSLLIYTNDDKAHVKWHEYKPEKNSLRYELYQWVWLKPGQTWDGPYDVVMKVMPKAGYNEWADEYARWGRQQWWAISKLPEKIRQRPLLKRYFENAIVRMSAGPVVCDRNSFRQTADMRWHYKEKNKYSKYEPYFDYVINQIPKYEQAYGGIKPGYWYPVWSGHQFDSQFPDYFPVTKWMGDFEKFHQAVEDNRWPMMYHVNPAIWSLTTKTAKDEKYHCTWRGRKFYFTSPHSKVKHVCTSPGVTFPVEMKVIKRLCKDSQANGLYMDCFGYGFANDDNPASEFSKYPNGYQRAKLKTFGAARKAVKGPFMTEGRNEIVMPYVDMGTGANGSEFKDEIPLWELVYGDCMANVSYGIREKRLRYYTWLIGGVQNMRWEPFDAKGKIIPVYLTSSQQKVVSHVVPERMERFDQLGGCRLSQWKSGIVLWHRESPDKPADIETDTTLGALDVKQFASDGIVILSDSTDFSADSVEQISLNGKTLFKCNPAQVSITRAGKRWVIHNEQKKAVKLTIQVASDWGNTASLSGKMVMSGQKCQIQPVEKDGWITINVKISPNECLVLDEEEPAYEFDGLT